VLGYDLKVQARAAEVRVVGLLQKVTLRGELAALAKREIAFGRWSKKAGCDFSGIPKAGSYAGDERPRWMRNLDPEDPVYSVLPGEAVYQLICTNCHGANADSRGRQADVLLLMSGGEARVANFREGLFGQGADGVPNRHRVFGERASASATADDLAARYFAWLGLGGTQRTIPPSILRVVSDTEVLGVKRPRDKPPPTSANMLSAAQEYCWDVLNSSVRADDRGRPTGGLDLRGNLVNQNGDAELWERLCTVENPQPLRALRNAFVKKFGSSNAPNFEVGFQPNVNDAWDLYPRDKYPSDAPVGDHRGQIVTGIQPENLMPWCIRLPLNPEARALATAYVNRSENRIGDKPMPFCPESVVPATDFAPEKDGHLARVGPEKAAWADRGAINAGISVYLYLEAITSGARKPTPRYDQCELLGR
jgi:hypothetical protein